MEQLTYISDKEWRNKVKLPWLTNFGTFNSLPEPYRELDLNDPAHLYEYWRAQDTYTPNATDYRQVVMGPGPIFSVRIFWYDDKALAIAPPRNWKIKDGKCVFLDQPRAWIIGCNHDFKMLTTTQARELGYQVGNCLHTTRCTRCKYIWHYDSSD